MPNRRFCTQSYHEIIFHQAAQYARPEINSIGYTRRQIENKMRQTMIKVTFLAAVIISTGGWIGLLGVGMWWLVVKL
jgi:hypothetical protein